MTKDDPDKPEVPKPKVPRAMNTNLLVLIPEFSGSRQGISCRRFLKMIDDYGNLEGWLSADKYNILNAKCVGEAGVILDTNPQANTYDEATKLLRERFQAPPTMSKIVPMMIDPRQRPDESCQRFTDRLKIIMNKSLNAFGADKKDSMRPLIEETLITTLKKGIRSERIKTALIHANPKTLEAAAAEVKKLEQQEEEFYPSKRGAFAVTAEYSDNEEEPAGATAMEVDQKEEEIGTALTQVTALIKAAADQLKLGSQESNRPNGEVSRKETRRCYTCDMIGHLQRNCRQKKKNQDQRRVKCYNCGGLGHKEAQCRKPRKNNEDQEDEGNKNDDRSKNLKRPLSQSK